MAEPASGAASPTQNAIELGGVAKRFENIVALHPTDLAVRRGEFLTLLGPSGSGKTTLLNLISGALAPSEGRVFFDGEDITTKPPRERGIGMVFQNYALMPHMTVFENVAYPLRIRGEAKADIARKVGEALARVGLTGFETRKPRQMSGGQQQRVGIARCIVYSPAIILMDEPLGALDKNLREQMQGEIKRLHLDLGTTFIYVTHDQEEALNMSDRICLMSQGAIAQLGTPEDLYFAPRNRFVAEFIGESNLVEGSLIDDCHLRAASGTTLAVPATDRTGDVRIMVRPERMRIHPPEPLPETIGINQLHGIVDTVSFVGGMTRVLVAADGGLKLLSKIVSDRAATRVQPGDRVTLGWDVADTVILAD